MRRAVFRPIADHHPHLVGMLVAISVCAIPAYWNSSSRGFTCSLRRWGSTPISHRPYRPLDEAGQRQWRRAMMTTLRNLRRGLFVGRLPASSRARRTIFTFPHRCAYFGSVKIAKIRYAIGYGLLAASGV